ncbi:hypothetical protein ACQ4PT_066652 [Festuca glaucescens]
MASVIRKETQEATDAAVTINMTTTVGGAHGPVAPTTATAAATTNASSGGGRHECTFTNIAVAPLPLENKADTPVAAAGPSRRRSGKEIVEAMGTEEEKKPLVVNMARARRAAPKRFLAVGVFLSVLAITSKSLIDNMKKIWKIRGRLDTNQLRDRRDDAVVVDVLNEGDDPEEVQFNSIPIWVQFKKIPFYLLSKQLAKDLGAKIGTSATCSSMESTQNHLRQPPKTVHQRQLAIVAHDASGVEKLSVQDLPPTGNQETNVKAPSTTTSTTPKQPSKQALDQAGTVVTVTTTLPQKTWKRIPRKEGDAGNLMPALTTQGGALGAPRTRPSLEEEDMALLPRAKKGSFPVPLLEQCLGAENLRNLREEEARQVAGRLPQCWEAEKDDPADEGSESLAQITDDKGKKKQAEENKPNQATAQKDCELLADPKGKQPASPQGATSSQPQRITEASWSKPDQGWTKLNFDASFLQEDNSGTWGAVLRDDKGLVILSAWGKIQNSANAEAAEAITGLQAVKAVAGAFAGPISIENDCATLIKEIKEANKSKPAIMNSVKEIRRLLELFPSYSVSKINRAANQVAHNLAKLGRNGSTECVLFGGVPPGVVDMANSECNETIMS